MTVTPTPVRTLPLLPCCTESIKAQVELSEIEGDSTTCDFSWGADTHRLIRINGEWRRIS